MKTERGTTIDLITKTGLFFLLLFSLLYGCSSQLDQSAEKTIQASLNAVGTKPDRDKIQNLVSLADCISANGKYTTEMHTASGGYSYFKQVYSYKPKPFEAVIEDKGTGFIIGDTLVPLSKEIISMIRGHEFQNIVLEVDKRYHDFEKPERIDTGVVKAYRIRAKDELNNACLLFFDQGTGLLSVIYSRNPDDKNEVIKIKFSNWKKVQDISLPHRVDIDQGKRIYVFDFTRVILNSPDFKRKN